MAGPAYRYRCTNGHEALKGYEGVHSCIPACTQTNADGMCGAEVFCVDADPRCFCGKRLYIDTHGKVYCPRYSRASAPDTQQET